MDPEVNRRDANYTDERRPATAPYARTSAGLVHQGSARAGSSHPGSSYTAPHRAGPSVHGANMAPQNLVGQNPVGQNLFGPNMIPSRQVGPRPTGPPLAPPNLPGQHQPGQHRPGQVLPGNQLVGPPAATTMPGSLPASSSGAPIPGATPSIADRFTDLLAPLSNKRRRGLIARLSVGYYEGWRPSRAEVSQLVTEELRRSPR